MRGFALQDMGFLVTLVFFPDGLSKLPVYSSASDREEL